MKSHPHYCLERQLEKEGCEEQDIACIEALIAEGFRLRPGHPRPLCPTRPEWLQFCLVLCFFQEITNMPWKDEKLPAKDDLSGLEARVKKLFGYYKDRLVPHSHENLIGAVARMLYPAHASADELVPRSRFLHHAANHPYAGMSHAPANIIPRARLMRMRKCGKSLCRETRAAIARCAGNLPDIAAMVTKHLCAKPILSPGSAP